MYILTMVLLVVINNPSTTTIQQEYTSLQKCKDAMETNRQSLSTAKVIMATCTLR